MPTIWRCACPALAGCPFDRPDHKHPQLALPTRIDPLRRGRFRSHLARSILRMAVRHRGLID